MGGVTAMAGLDFDTRATGRSHAQFGRDVAVNLFRSCSFILVLVQENNNIDYRLSMVEEGYWWSMTGACFASTASHSFSNFPFSLFDFPRYRYSTPPPSPTPSCDQQHPPFTTILLLLFIASEDVGREQGIRLPGLPSPPIYS